MHIKICGIKDPSHAAISAQLGAKFIGLMFFEQSKRCIDLATAKLVSEEAKKFGSEPVAIFVDKNEKEINEIIHTLDLKYVQLHGDISKSAYKHLPKDVHVIYQVENFNDPDIDLLDPQKDYLLFDRSSGTAQKVNLKEFNPKTKMKYFLAGGLDINNVGEALSLFHPFGVDISSGVEEEKGKKDLTLLKAFINKVQQHGKFDKFGGKYVPELLIKPLEELEKSFEFFRKSKDFQKEFFSLLQEYAGRSTPLTEVPRFSKAIKGPRIFLKREDLLHTGAHKINNALGQCLLAKKMGKTRVIAETGAGQHGVATATAAAKLGLECVIYMGKKDAQRQEPNVKKMKLLGAKVIFVEAGSMTLKEAVSESMRDWAKTFKNTHYCLGSALGPHPYPQMVAAFQAIIGHEVKQQMHEKLGKNPDMIVACVGGGSNAIGIFAPFIGDQKVQLVGVEAGGKKEELGNHAARFLNPKQGVLHGTSTYILQDENGQIAPTHSVSAGLDYPAVGPQHAYLFDKKCAKYTSATDKEALKAFALLARKEGIIAALESSHALAYVQKIAHTLPKDTVVVINLSGRGDKDLPQIFEEKLLEGL